MIRVNAREFFTELKTPRYKIPVMWFQSVRS